MNEKIQGLVNRQTRIYLDFLIGNIRQQAGHEEYSWNDAIDYLIDKLNEVRDK